MIVQRHVWTVPFLSKGPQLCPEFCRLCLVNATRLQVDMTRLQKCHNYPRFVAHISGEFSKFNLTIPIYTFDALEHTTSSVFIHSTRAAERCKHHNFREGSLTLAVSCCRKRERGTSGRFWQSAPLPC